MARELRGDIQGLRAVAVLTVIAAHAGVPFLPGGFVGVDVFFVISGYLIASLLYREVLLTGRVSIGAFWARRARRILPAATLVTVVTVLLSLAWMSLLDARAGRHRRALGLGVRGQHPLRPAGGLLLRRGRGPLPAPALLVAGRRGAVLRRLAAAAGGAASPSPRWLRQGQGPTGGAAAPQRRAHHAGRPDPRVAGLVGPRDRRRPPSSAYFSTLTRAWELGVGALVALVPPTFVRRLTRLSLEAMAVTGAVMLLTACIVITAETPFPGIAAVLPVVGTAMLILSGAAADAPGRRTVSSQVLAVAPMRIIGDWSYSLYLWHWPAFILLPVALDRAMTPFEKCARGPRGDHALGVLLPLRRDAVPRRPARAQAAPAAGAGALPGQRRPRGRHRGRRLVVDRLPGRRARRQPADHGRRRPDRRPARQHRGAGARVGHRRQGQARGAEQPHPRPAQPARLDRRRRRLRLRGERPHAVPARRRRPHRSW